MIECQMGHPNLLQSRCRIMSWVVRPVVFGLAVGGISGMCCCCLVPGQCVAAAQAIYGPRVLAVTIV